MVGGEGDVVGGTDDEVVGIDEDVDDGGAVDEGVVDDDVGENVVDVGDPNDAAGLHCELDSEPLQASAALECENAK